MREAARLGAKVLVVSNVVDSSMARAADGVLYTRAGPEIGVASTKCHLAQIVALEVLGLYLAQLLGTLPASEINEILNAMEVLPGLVTEALARAGDVDDVAAKLTDARDFFFLGRHVGLPGRAGGRAQAEGAGLPAGRGLPGRRAQARADRADRAGHRRRRHRHAQPAVGEDALQHRRGAQPRRDRRAAWPTTATRSPPRWRTTCCGCRRPTRCSSPVVGVVPLQQLAYRLARLHGHDPDRPRNLAKTVTVE